MSQIDVDIRGPLPEKGVFVRTCTQKHRDPERTPRRFSDDGARRFDRTICAWVAVGVPIDRHGRIVGADPRPGPSAIPARDGSGVWWRAADRGGQPLWTIEAIDFAAALAEKQRLCGLSGRKSGSVYLVGV